MTNNWHRLLLDVHCKYAKLAESQSSNTTRGAQSVPDTFPVGYLCTSNPAGRGFPGVGIKWKTSRGVMHMVRTMKRGLSDVLRRHAKSQFLSFMPQNGFQALFVFYSFQCAAFQFRLIVANMHFTCYIDKTPLFVKTKSCSMLTQASGLENIEIGGMHFLLGQKLNSLNSREQLCFCMRASPAVILLCCRQHGTGNSAKAKESHSQAT